MQNTPGLGELLRYVSDLVDSGSEKTYRDMAITYRPRFTPVLRAMAAGAQTVTDITAQTFLTQGAISQSVTMMEKEGILHKVALEDGRKSRLQFTEQGDALVAELQPHWQTLFVAIEQLEKETGHPLLTILQDTARALENKGFDERIRQAKTGLTDEGKTTC